MYFIILIYGKFTYINKTFLAIGNAKNEEGPINRMLIIIIM